MTNLRRIPKSIWIGIAIFVSLAVYAVPRLETGRLSEAVAAAQLISPGAVQVPKGQGELPAEGRFEKAGVAGALELWLDRTTGHFKVLDQRNGNVWHSYPDPDHWAQENQSGIWRTHLRSPIMLKYMDLNGNKAKTQPKETNFLEEQGTVTDVRLIDRGFRLTFDMPAKQLAIPVEVTLEEDSVAVKVIDAGIREGALSLLSLRVYPMFGAAHATGQEGFLFVPDGSGTTIPFRENHTNVSRIYQEPVYGVDDAFRLPGYEWSRLRVAMPVFGLRSGNRAFLSVVESGAEYADIIASPSKVFSGYNWATAQQNYRLPYTIVTNKKKQTFFQTYSKEERFGGDRTVRYLLLNKAETGYVGMAERYRSYLIGRYGLEPIRRTNDKLPLTVALLGAEQVTGLLNDRYVANTTTDEAKAIVRTLYDQGIDKITVQYMGWQKDGFSAAGNFTAVDPRIGGNAGMKSFASWAHSLGIPVYLHVEYGRNLTGGDGFESKRQGQRDKGGATLNDLASLGFLDKIVDRHIEFYRSLGVDGLQVRTLGAKLNSDYNSAYPLSREQSRIEQERLFRTFKEAKLDVRGFSSNLYVLPYVSAIDRLENDYSYDTFSDSDIPFMQIALHGLIAYTSNYSNERQEFRRQMLRDLEYGAAPSYIFTHDNGDNLLFSNEITLQSSDYVNWLQAAVEEYRVMNAALGDVQHEWIVNHRTLAPNVKETTYAGGKRIVVNYGEEPYTYGQSVVKPADYLIVTGGAPK